ncbi:hypothetical protein HPO96_16390 [Kribbella sandramycini]|uniref:Uncharacterized protein n=1 Tax=Kribbella sandramycini TaxID=60450 RepID=A0A7Y4L033_9ACTN|nr:hypothetical protein [Kribbella sandramycini]MBB6565563.1 hypothetical protein [Kribbella sandramycini]NOL41828.1 hypothetical protein [Kribbella sandramycini]
MRLGTRAARAAAQISLLVVLLALACFLTLRTYLGDPEQNYNDGAIHEVVDKGPVTIGKATWQLNSLDVYTRLVDTDGEEIRVGRPTGAVIVVADLSVTPLDGLRLKEGGFSCATQLRDDRGNSWAATDASKYPVPTRCSDSDHPMIRNKANKLAQIFIVPQEAVPHLSGVELTDRDNYRRYVIKP